MKLPIPDDWDETSWAMWAVCWPDSTSWRGILQGQLTEMANRLTWDSETGSIDDVVDIGIEIGNENVTLTGAIMRCDDQLNELIAAIGAIGFGGARCGCGGGEREGTTNGSEGGSPPEKFSAPPNPPGTPEYDERKCKVANASYDNILELLRELEKTGIDAYIGRGFLGSAAFILLTTMIAGAIGEIITPVPIIDGLVGAVIGFVAGLAGVITANSFSLADLITDVEDNGQDLVCGLYEAIDADTAANNFVDVLDAAGASAGGLLMIEAILWVDYLNALFFSPDDESAFESQLAGYTPTYSCASCTPCLNYWMGVGSVALDNWPTSLDLVSGSGGCGESIVVYFRYDTSDFCGPGVVVSDISMTGHTPSSSCTDFVLWDDVPSVIASSDVDVTVLYGLEGWIVELNSNASFTATVTFTPQ